MSWSAPKWPISRNPERTAESKVTGLQKLIMATVHSRSDSPATISLLSPSQTGESLQHWQLQEQKRGKVFPFLNKNCASKQHQFSRPAASSLSPDPTGHLCCQTRSPPHNPEAPAATPSPSPQPPTLKQVIITFHHKKEKWMNINC